MDALIKLQQGLAGLREKIKAMREYRVFSLEFLMKEDRCSLWISEHLGRQSFLYAGVGILKHDGSRWQGLENTCAKLWKFIDNFEEDNIERVEILSNVEMPVQEKKQRLMRYRTGCTDFDLEGLSILYLLTRKEIFNTKTPYRMGEYPAVKYALACMAAGI